MRIGGILTRSVTKSKVNMPSYALCVYQSVTEILSDILTVILRNLIIKSD